VECFDSLDALAARAQELNGNCALLGCELPGEIPAQVREDLGTDAIGMAAGLFAALRRLDAAPVAAILALLPRSEGLGLAVRDRLIRAGGSRPVR
jgi:L-threonylcarbamoyladenylate synthase